MTDIDVLLMSSVLQVQVSNVVRFLQLTITNLKGQELARPVLVVSRPGEVIVLIVSRLEESLYLEMFQATVLIEERGSLPH